MSHNASDPAPSKTMARTVAYLAKFGICAASADKEPMYASFASAYDILKDSVWTALVSVQSGQLSKEDAYHGVSQKMKDLIHCLGPIIRDKDDQIAQLTDKGHTDRTAAPAPANVDTPESDLPLLAQLPEASEVERLKEELASTKEAFEKKRMEWKSELDTLIKEWKSAYEVLEQERYQQQQQQLKHDHAETYAPEDTP